MTILMLVFIVVLVAVVGLVVCRSCGVQAQRRRIRGRARRLEHQLDREASRVQQHMTRYASRQLRRNRR